VGHTEPSDIASVVDGRGRVLRVFRFRPVRPAFDVVLRDVMIPDLAGLEGLEATIVGRRGPGELGERIVATIWSSAAAMEAGVGASFDLPIFHPEHFDDTEEKRLDIAPIRFCHAGESADVGVVRLVLGATRPGARDEYLRAARIGTEADLAEGRGPLSLYLGTLDEDRFATISLWSQWSTVGEATGGSIAHPESTRHAELLVDWHAEHYEVVPGLTSATPGR
jgi:hypothetical protein